jgi:hypothetical protein
MDSGPGVTTAAYVDGVRSAIRGRATWFALLYRSFATALPADHVEALAREAIYAAGRLRGEADGDDFTPATWADCFLRDGTTQFFDLDITSAPGVCMEMNTCALVDAWRAMGCTPQEVDLFCDIAMEGDRGRADHHGIQIEIPERMGKGDAHCRMLLGVAPEGSTPA